jgi:hypothetical protein
MAIVLKDTSNVDLNKDWAINPAVAGNTYTLPSEFKNASNKGDYRFIICNWSAMNDADKVKKYVYSGTTFSGLPSGFVYDNAAATITVPTGFNGSIALIKATGNSLFDSTNPNDFFTKSDIPDNNNTVVSKTFKIVFTDFDYENVIVSIEDLLNGANVDGDSYPDMDTISMVIKSGGTTVFSGNGVAGSNLNSTVINSSYTTQNSELQVTITMDLSDDPDAWSSIDASKFFLNYNIKVVGNTIAQL